jgi:amino acid adenylation domain-containing protein
VTDIGERHGRRVETAPVLSAANQSLTAGFDETVAAHRFRTALISDGWQPTYEELNVVANRLAHAIIARSGAPGDRIAILMQHDAPAIAAVLAILKAGHIVVALNPTHPLARLRELIEDCEPSVIVVDASFRNLASEIVGPGCAVISFEEHSAKGPGHNPSIIVPPAQVAALVYTSGTTGHPKGVMLTHRQLRRDALINTEAMAYRAEDRIPLFSSLSATQGMLITCCAMLSGAALCPFPVISKGVTGLADWMTRHRITVYVSTASIFRNFMKTLPAEFRFSNVRSIRVSAEPTTLEDFKLFRAHFPVDCWFVHSFSCSETSNIAWSRHSQGDMLSEGRLPVGAISRGHEVLILDEDSRPIANGNVGEITVRGRYVAAGYWRQPELTAERFSVDPDDSDVRLVRTGDLGRINAAGMLELHGRRDDRVKIRGNRIELSEIAEALHRLTGVERAVVEAMPRAGREPLLVAFVSIREKQFWPPTELRRALRKMLPGHMVPSEFVILQSFPLTPTGKIDRQKLRQDYHPQRQLQSGEPNTAAERLLAEIWAEVFELPEIGKYDDFFALGGDSLMAAVIAARVHDAVKVELNLAMFADHPTLAQLALAVDQLREAAMQNEPPLVPVPRNAPLPLSFAQERIWRFSQTATASAAYISSRAFRIVGPLDVELLRGCMDDLVRRHEILRTTFRLESGRPVQIVHPPGPAELGYVDLSHAGDPESQAMLIFKTETGVAIDITRGPLIRFTLVRLRDGEYRLFRHSHHIVNDNASWVVYFRELAMLYQAKLGGGPSPLTEFAALQYGDYAVWQRKMLDRDGPVFKRSVAWWKDQFTKAPLGQSLPFTRPTPTADAVAADGVFTWRVERQVSSRLNAFAAERSTTRPTIRLAAFAALLAIETNNSEAIIGMYMTGRNRVPLQNMFGDFSNLTTLRFRLDPEKSFAEWLALVRDQVLGAEKHSAIPYEELGDELRQQGVRVPQIKVIFHVSPPARPIEFGAAKLLWADRIYERIQWGFTLDYEEENDRRDGHVLFDPRIYDPAAVQVFVTRYKRLLDAVSRDPSKTLNALLTMSAENT